MATYPALASTADLAARARDAIASDDAGALWVLDTASALIRSYVGTTLLPDGWVEDDPFTPPDGARAVAVEVAYRVWSNPDNLVADSIDDGSRRWSERAADGFFLTAADRLILDGLKSKRSGLWTLGVTRDDGSLDTVYIPTGPPPSGDPFPWYAADDPLVWGET